MVGLNRWEREDRKKISGHNATNRDVTRAPAPEMEQQAGSGFALKRTGGFAKRAQEKISDLSVEVNREPDLTLLL